MTKAIQIYAYVHSIEGGIATLTPTDSHLNRCKINIADIDLVFGSSEARRVLVTIPEYLAIGKGLRKPDPVEQYVSESIDWGELKVPGYTPTQEQAEVDSQNLLLRHAVRKQGDAFRKELEGVEI